MVLIALSRSGPSSVQAFDLKKPTKFDLVINLITVEGAGPYHPADTAGARRRGDRIIAVLLRRVCPLMGWPGRAPALQDVRSCGGLRSTRSTSHVTQVRTTHRQHDRHRSR